MRDAVRGVMTSYPSQTPKSARRLARMAGAPMLRLLILLGFGLALGACTKCDVPTWPRSSAGLMPAVCHDGPPAQ
jgi:hypothetical protein